MRPKHKARFHKGQVVFDKVDLRYDKITQLFRPGIITGEWCYSLKGDGACVDHSESTLRSLTPREKGA